MTDTEAKALALVNFHAINRRSDLDDAKHTELRCALLDAVQSQAATEARHAAELREQAERFSEVAYRAKDMLDTFYRNGAGEFLSPFILPKPDPLVEALEAAVKAYIAEHGIEAFKALPMFGSAKIVGEG